ncbi:MAG: hypothetical protein AUJ57_10360 [Zetaproteobacteria bacterium CG1_02_53_45]|nr:MAG: hypothetical protein AUJ57_10360 [Zetaproteobacteria bacterium CG1_02_53_45]
MLPDNIFSGFPAGLVEELTEPLLQSQHMRLERIISHGQSTPAGQWYDQAQDEWVILLQGQARLQLAQQPDEVSLQAGDYLHIPAHCKHRVSWTDPDQTSLWLALFFTP